MTILYDQEGNVIGDDGTPDSQSPSLAEMKAALQYKGQMPSNPNGSDVPLVINSPEYKAALQKAQNLSSSWEDNSQLPTKGNYGPMDLIKAGMQNMPDAGIGSAAATMLSGMVGQTAGVPVGIAQSIINGTYGTQEGVNQAQNTAGQVANALTIAPTSQGQSVIDAGNELVGKITGSSMPIVSPGMVHEPFKLDPNAGRVLGAQAKMYSNELKDLHTDFANAQSGVKKMNAVGDYTIGTRLQEAADDIADFAARRKAQGKSPIPGVPQASVEVFGPQQMNAVRNTGQWMPVKAEDIPDGAKTHEMNEEPKLNSIVRATKSIPEDYRPIDVLSEYVRHYIEPNENNAGHEAISDAWRNFLKEKKREMYPDAPSESAVEQAFDSRGNGQQKAPLIIQWIDEFAKNPKVKELARVTRLKPLPDIEEFEKRRQTANNWSDKAFVKHITRNVGTADDPFINLSKSGITFKPAQRIIEEGGQPNATYWPDDALQQLRVANGKHPFGETYPVLEAKKADVDRLTQELEDMKNHRTNLGQQLYAENPDRDPADNPEYAATSGRIRAKSNELDQHKEQYENLRLANAYENINDSAIKPITVQEFLNQTPYRSHQFFPQLKDTFNPPLVKAGEYKVPRTDTMYNVMRNAMNALGLIDAGKAFHRAIMFGDIPVDQVPNTSFPKFVTDVYNKRLEKERAEKLEQVAKLKVFNTYAKDLAEEPNIPKIGNTAVFEFKRGMPIDDIRRGLAMDTEVLDHCVGSGGSGGETKHFLTGHNRTHVPVVDPVTGEVPQLSSGRIGPGYDDDIHRGSKQITSLRDKETGYPYGTIEFINEGRANAASPRFRLGYVSGYKNHNNAFNGIDPKYRKDVQDYVNSRANEIESPGSNLAHAIGIFDRTRDNLLSEAFSQAGIIPADKRAMESVIRDLPRFITVEDIQAIKNGTYRPSGSAITQGAPKAQTFAQRHEALSNEMTELQEQHNQLVVDDPTDHEGQEALQHELNDRIRAFERHQQELDLPSTMGRAMQREEQRLSPESYQQYEHILDSINDNFDLEAEPVQYIDRLYAHANQSGANPLAEAFRSTADALSERINADVPSTDVRPTAPTPAAPSVRQGYLDRAYREVSQNIRNRHQNPEILQAIQRNGNTRQNLIQVMDDHPDMYGLNAYQPDFRNELIERFRNEGLYVPTNDQTLGRGRANPAVVQARSLGVAPPEQRVARAPEQRVARAPGRNAMSGAPERRANLASATSGAIGNDEIEAMSRRQPLPAIQHASGEVQRAYQQLIQGVQYRWRTPQEHLTALNEIASRMQNSSPEVYNLRSSVGLRNLKTLMRRHIQVLQTYIGQPQP